MNAFRLLQDRQPIRVLAAMAMLVLVSSCSNRPNDRFQGYVEGEFVYVSSPLAGTLESLRVQRGQQVKAGDPLFALDRTAEKAARDQIKAALLLSQANYVRQDELFRTGASATQDLDNARSAQDQDQ